MLRFRNKHRAVEIPTSSLADVAFLLLVFFLVATTIDSDAGLQALLPPISEEPPPDILKRNVLSILINAEGAILVEERPTELPGVQEEVVIHSTNFGRYPQYAVSPQKALVSIQTDPKAPYALYVDVLDEVYLGFWRIWDTEARTLGFADYRAYTTNLKGRPDAIRQKYPANLAVPLAEE